MAYVAQAAVGYMGEINASAKNDIVKDFRNRNDEMLAKTVKVGTLHEVYKYACVVGILIFTPCQSLVLVLPLNSTVLL